MRIAFQLQSISDFHNHVISTDNILDYEFPSNLSGVAADTVAIAPFPGPFRVAGAGKENRILAFRVRDPIQPLNFVERDLRALGLTLATYSPAAERKTT